MDRASARGTSLAFCEINETIHASKPAWTSPGMCRSGWHPTWGGVSQFEDGQLAIADIPKPNFMEQRAGSSVGVHGGVASHNWILILPHTLIEWATE